MRTLTFTFPVDILRLYPASPELGQPQQSRRKSRRGGKGKKKTGKSPLSSGYASSPPIVEEGEESQPRVDDSELKPFTDAGSSFAADAILTFAPSKLHQLDH